MELYKTYSALYSGFEIQPQLFQELLGHKYELKGNLVLVKNLKVKPVWIQNIWNNIQIIPIDSIKDGSLKLKAIARLWIHNPITSIRRGELILQSLPHFKVKLFKPFSALPTSKICSFSLLSNTELLVLTEGRSCFANGEIAFEEDKVNPPSRAYLKLWEVFTRLNTKPKKGELCLDIGAAPGGWSWVLSELGAKVIAYDRSPLEISNPMIKFIKGDGFNILPENFSGSGEIDWLVSDIIAFPSKQLEYLLKWHKSDRCKRIIATFKFKGSAKLDEEALKVIAELKALPNSILIHLTANKNELTYVSAPEVQNFSW